MYERVTKLSCCRYITIRTDLSVHNTLEKCENAALFLRLRRPSTSDLSRKRGIFQKHSSNAAPALGFGVGEEHFDNRNFSKMMTPRRSYYFSDRVLLEHKGEMNSGCCVLHFSGVVWTVDGFSE